MNNQLTTVAITGAAGNLGTKLIRHLAAGDQVKKAIGLDLHLPDNESKVLEGIDTDNFDLSYVQCDIGDWHDHRWQDTLNQVDAVVHFAAQNPYPEASWLDSGISMDINNNVIIAAADSSSIKRVVFATSNHVMGRYKDSPWSEMIGPGELGSDTPPEVGTVWFTGKEHVNAAPYATAKFAGERLCKTLGAREQRKAAQNPAHERTTFVCVRIGWCQPGENLPTTLSAAGTPTLDQGDTLGDPEDLARSDRWFKGMWLSNRDFTQLFEKAILADGSAWPDSYILVNGMSQNTGMAWRLDETKALLGYEPVDDVYV
ncbi:MAG: NAD(P)-dependent oxidoreductase [Chloroflexota bacterium]